VVARSFVAEEAPGGGARVGGSVSPAPVDAVRRSSRTTNPGPSRRCASDRFACGGSPCPDRSAARRPFRPVSALASSSKVNAARHPPTEQLPRVEDHAREALRLVVSPGCLIPGQTTTRNPPNLWISPARRSGGDPSVSRSDSTTLARKVASARTRATRWEPFPNASGPRREECVGEGETGRSRLRPRRHPGPETQRRGARLDRGRGLHVNRVGGRVLGEALRRSRSERSSSATFGQVGRSTSTAVAVPRAWSLSSASPRWADVGVSRGRIDLGRDVRTLIEEAALFGL